MGKSKKTTIARLVNTNNCKAVLEKKLSLNRKPDDEKLGFQSDARIFVSKNLTPNNQHLAWKCTGLEQAGKIHSCWSAKGVVKIRITMNERPIEITMTLNLLVYTLILFSKREQDQGELLFKERINSG